MIGEEDEKEEERQSQKGKEDVQEMQNEVVLGLCMLLSVPRAIQARVALQTLIDAHPNIPSSALP